jgi:trehalose utilization protein
MQPTIDRPDTTSRRDFLSVLSAATVGGVLPIGTLAQAEEPAIPVVVWDERQPAQKEAYPNFLGNAIAEHLKAQPGLSVRSVALDDPEQGLSDDVLGPCRVLIWWGHVRQGEVAPEVGKKIVARIKSGSLSLIALHSAHWATPFMEAMNERARMDCAKNHHTDLPNTEVKEIPPPTRNIVPKRDARLTPYVESRRFPNGARTLELHLPFCCFPAYRNDGTPSQLRVRKPEHPIAQGVPGSFEIAREEMYDEPFHVPPPDEVLFEERWASGDWFRSGMVWQLGKGRVFYFRPGHETYPTYTLPEPLRIVSNAVRWLAGPVS